MGGMYLQHSSRVGRGFLTVYMLQGYAPLSYVYPNTWEWGHGEVGEISGSTKNLVGSNHNCNLSKNRCTSKGAEMLQEVHNLIQTHSTVLGDRRRFSLLLVAGC